MLCVSVNASWLPSPVGSVLGKRAWTESDCSRGGGRVRKRSKECPRLHCAFHAWHNRMHRDLGNRSFEEGQQWCARPGRAHCTHTPVPSSCRPAPEMHPSMDTQRHRWAPGTQCWWLYLARTPPRGAVRRDHEPETLPLSERMRQVEMSTQCKAVLGSKPQK